MASEGYENQLPDGDLKRKDTLLSGDSEDELQKFTENESQFTPQYDDTESQTTIPTQSGFGRMQRRQMSILYHGGKREEEALEEAIKLSLAESSKQETGESPEDFCTSVDETRVEKEISVYDEEECFAQARQDSLTDSQQQEIWEPQEDSYTSVDEPRIKNEISFNDEECFAQATRGSLADSQQQEIWEPQEDSYTFVGEARIKSEISFNDEEECFAQCRQDSLTESQQQGIWEPDKDSDTFVDAGIAQASVESLVESGPQEIPTYNKREAIAQERKDMEQAMIESLIESGQLEIPISNKREAIAHERKDVEQAMIESLIESGLQEIPKYNKREAIAQERKDIEQAMIESLIELGQLEIPKYNKREAIAQERKDMEQAMIESLIESGQQEIPKYNKREAIAQERKGIEQAMMESLVESGQQEIRQPGSTSYTSTNKTIMENEIMVGQTRVVVKQGDITRQKADALVNIVDPSGEFPGRSVVGKAFARSGGSQLVQNYQAKRIEIEESEVNGDDTPSSLMVWNATTYKYITITESAGNLECKDVIHVKLKRNKPQILQDVMREIYQACSNNGYQVICLPPLGIGQLYSYPAEQVASCLLEATCSSLRQGKIQMQEVRFVVVERDPETYMIFDSVLHQFNQPAITQNQLQACWSQKSQLQLQMNPEFLQPYPAEEYMTTGQRHVKKKMIAGSEVHYSPHFKRQHLSPEQNFLHDPCKSGTSHHQGERSRPQRKDMYPNSRHTSSTNTERTRGRSLEAETRHVNEGPQESTIKPFRRDKEKQYRVRSKSLDRCQSEKPQNKYSGEHGYAVKANEEKKLRKNREYTHKARRDTQQVFLDDKSHDQHAQRKRQRSGLRRGTPEFTKLMARYEAEVPKYWKHFQPGEILKNIIVNIKNLLTSEKYVKVKLDDHCSTYKAIVHFINKTFHAGEKHIGQGKDASGIQPYRQFFVVKIHRIENPELFTGYTTKREEIFSRLCKKNLGYFSKLEKVQTGKTPCQPIKSVCLGENQELGEDMYEEVNEYYFFHGTKPEFIDKICSDGLDYRLCSPDAMLGQGIYGAESVIKADQYTDDKDRRKGGPKKMFLMRMLLGNIFVCTADDPHKYRRAPCTKCFMDNCVNVKHHDHFDSVVGGMKKRFREFVVYDSKQCYPEYLITYERR